jgi:ribonuclease P protein component
MTLPKDKRIRKRRDYLRVQRFGARSFGRFIVVIAQKCHEGDLFKVGFTVPKKVGAAHTRNKIKRRLRHIVRSNQNIFFERMIVIVARDSANLATFSELETDVLDAVCKLKSRPKISMFPSKNFTCKIA